MLGSRQTIACSTQTKYLVYCSLLLLQNITLDSLCRSTTPCAYILLDFILEPKLNYNKTFDNMAAEAFNAYKTIPLSIVLSSIK